jgi:hypothetical protein
MLLELLKTMLSWMAISAWHHRSSRVFNAK